MKHVALLGVLIASLFLSGCERTIVVYLFRLTVEVEADGKKYSGSSVIRVRHFRVSDWLPGGGVSRNRMSGEAVFVDIPGRGNIVVPLVGNHSWRHPSMGGGSIYDPLHYAFFPDGDVYSRLSELGTRSFAGQKREVDPTKLPGIISFKDVNDCSSMVRLPYRDIPDIAPLLGPGARISKVTVELVSDWWVSSGLEERLPCIADKATGDKILPQENRKRASRPKQFYDLKRSGW